MRCKHLWLRDGYSRCRERYYCQKCLIIIEVERWEDITNVFIKGNKVKWVGKE